VDGSVRHLEVGHYRVPASVEDGDGGVSRRRFAEIDVQVERRLPQLLALIGTRALALSMSESYSRKSDHE
jgi:hypothetical protein